MDSRRQMGRLIGAVVVLVALMIFMRYTLPEAENSNLAGAEFLVS